jgi:hypothetical protein
MWFFWLRHCGFGTGTGGPGGGGGAVSGPPGEASRGPDGAAACALRVDAAGTHVDGKPASVEEAVAVCKRTGAAVLLITGDARYGAANRLKEALRAAAVPVTSR